MVLLMQKKQQQPTYWSFLSLSSTCYITARNIANIIGCVVFQFSLKGWRTNKNKSCRIYKLITAKKSEECYGHFLSSFYSVLFMQHHTDLWQDTPYWDCFHNLLAFFSLCQVLLVMGFQTPFPVMEFHIPFSFAFTPFRKSTFCPGNLVTSAVHAMWYVELIAN